MTQTAEGPVAHTTGPTQTEIAPATEALDVEGTAWVSPSAGALLAAALDYAGRGWPVFPCVPGGKEPATVHGFKDATTDPRMIAAWWRHVPHANVAIATGAPAVDVVDVDVKPEGSGWAAFNAAKRAGLLAGAVALVRTRSGGLHVYFPGTGQRNGSIRRRHLDFRGAGGYVIAPPSVVEGRSYELLDERTGGRPVDWAGIVALLDPPPVRPAARSRPRAAEGGASPGDDFNARTEWHDVLAPHGWRFLYSRGETSYWRRPGKERGVSATTNALGTDRLHVFSSSTEFDAGTSYSKFGAYAVLHHGGNHSAAAAALRLNGYGGSR